MVYNFNKWDVDLIQEPNLLLEKLKSMGIKYKTIKSIRLVGIDFQIDDLIAGWSVNPSSNNDIEFCYINDLGDDYMFDRFVDVDQPIIIEFEDGDRLEIDYSECGSLKIGLNSLHKSVESYNGRANLDANVIFSNCIGQKIIGFEVGMQDRFELTHDFTGSYGIEEPKNQSSYICKFAIVLSGYTMINFTSVFDYGRIWITNYQGHFYQIPWKELKTGLIKPEDSAK